MDSWNKFNEPAPLVEDHYYSELNKDCAAKEDLKDVQKVCDTFKIKSSDNIMICMFNLIQHHLQMYLKTLEIIA